MFRMIDFSANVEFSLENTIETETLEEAQAYAALAEERARRAGAKPIVEIFALAANGHISGENLR